MHGNQFATLEGVTPHLQQPGYAQQPQYGQANYNAGLPAQHYGVSPQYGAAIVAPVDPILAEKAANRFNYSVADWQDLPFLGLFVLNFLIICILSGVYGGKTFTGTATAIVSLSPDFAQALYVW